MKSEPFFLVVVGLIAGFLLYPLLGLMAASGLGRVLESCIRFLSAPFQMIGRMFQRGVEMSQSGSRTRATMLKVNPQEEQIKASSLALRNILLSLAVVIQRTDVAASNSNQTLGDVKNSIVKMDSQNDLAEAHTLLMREIDRMISGNTDLKKELANSQNSLAAQRRQIDELRSAVRMDGLTQIANRAYFDEKLVEMVKLWRRHNDVFSLLLVDVDNFKNINDQFGHPAGDRVIKGVAFNLRAALRESDFVARFGGDEFAILLYRSNAGTAVEVARKLCKAQQESRLLLDGKKIDVTLSIGIAESVADDTAESILKRADQALYRVKSEGRNGVHCL